MDDQAQVEARPVAGGILRWYGIAWVLFGLCPPVVAVQGDPGTAKYWSLLVTATLGAAYLAVRRRFPEMPGATLYLCGLVLGLGVMARMSGGAAMFIAALPQFWVFTAGPRRALAFGAAGATATVLGGVTVAVPRMGFGGGGVVVVVIGYLVSSLLGLGAHRAIRQSAERERRLGAELAETQRQLAEAHRRQGATEERERLAREIHDTLAQGLASIVVLAEAARTNLDGDLVRAARQLTSIENTARENLAEARALVGAAPREGVAAGSVAQALRRTLDRFAEDTGLTVTAELSDVECDRRTWIALLRCTQESLANVRKHADATTVGVVLERHPHGVELEITDDGKGFVVARARGFGLDGMRRRLAELGGALTVTSSLGDGTRVLAVLPLSDDPEVR
ncbi:sensor histidine kinase [Actinomadura kijaniata]|uniref:sensor histidine kinase n=1 Tax=Actinomadura kijaniata TaxID=46161 RepID=UPI003F1B5872